MDHYFPASGGMHQRNPADNRGTRTSAATITTATTATPTTRTISAATTTSSSSSVIDDPNDPHALLLQFDRLLQQAHQHHTEQAAAAHQQQQQHQQQQRLHRLRPTEPSIGAFGSNNNNNKNNEEYHSFFSYNPVFDSSPAVVTPEQLQQPQHQQQVHHQASNLLVGNSSSSSRRCYSPQSFNNNQNLNQNLNQNQSLHSIRDDSSSYFSSYQYPPSIGGDSSQYHQHQQQQQYHQLQHLQQSQFQLKQHQHLQEYPPVQPSSNHSSSSSVPSSQKLYPYHHHPLTTTTTPASGALHHHPNSNNSTNFSHSNNSSSPPGRRSNTNRRGPTTASSSNSNCSNNNKRSAFARQDSGISDLDCSDHSGISFHSGLSSVTPHSTAAATAAARPTSPHNNTKIHPTNENLREMYFRQDSERSFCSSSASSVGTNSTTYSSDASNPISCNSSGKFLHNYRKPVMPPKSQYVAMDCEMVGTLTGQSVCARVVLVDWKGRSVLDEYVRPLETITDYRTFVSGITQEQLREASTLAEIRPRVQAAIAGKIVIGHGLNNDLECLGVEHPWHMIRDTALYEPFMKMHYGQLNPRKLKDLASERLNRDIQMPGKAHSPAEDALAALDLYKSHRPRWEACMTAQIKEGQRLLIEQQKQREQYERYFAGLPIVAFP